MSIELIIAVALITSVAATSVVFYKLSRDERVRIKFSRELEHTIRRHPAGKKLLTEEEIISND